MLWRSAILLQPRLPRRALLVACGLVLSLAAAPSAFASCGHYVDLTGPQAAAPEGTGSADAPEAPVPAAPFAPCTGPHCSRAPAPAPVAPPAPVTPARDPCGSAMVDTPPAPAARSLSSDAGGGRPVHRCFPPERPPR